MKILKNDWQNYLGEEFKKDYYQNLREFLIKEYSTKKIHPKPEEIYNAFHYTSYKDTKVVVLGQDPYHGPSQAHGLSFSVQKGQRIPPSLMNIYKEINQELGYEIPSHGNLKSWADQGVLLLNTVLTVREKEPGSHRNKGWEILTDKAIESLNKKEHPVVFLLWGSDARSKKDLIDQSFHYVLESYHPSPLAASRGFFGNGHFIKTNKILTDLGIEPIDWKID